MRRHVKTCFEGESKFHYLTGPFESIKPLHVRAKELGLPFPEGEEDYPYKMVLDIECSLPPPCEGPPSKRPRLDESAKTRYTAEHRLLSIAVATNFVHPDIEPVVCFIRKGDSVDDEREVMQEALAYMLRVQTLIKPDRFSVFGPLLEILDQRIVEERLFEEGFSNGGKKVRLDQSLL